MLSAEIQYDLFLDIGLEMYPIVLANTGGFIIARLIISICTHFQNKQKHTVKTHFSFFMKTAASSQLWLMCKVRQILSYVLLAWDQGCRLDI